MVRLGGRAGGCWDVATGDLRSRRRNTSTHTNTAAPRARALEPSSTAASNAKAPNASTDAKVKAGPRLGDSAMEFMADSTAKALAPLREDALSATGSSATGSFAIDGSGAGGTAEPPGPAADASH